MLANGKMANPPVDTPSVTTMTHVFPLDGWVNFRAAYELLPWTPVSVEPSKRRRKKCKLPVAEPGNIVRLCYGPWTRGTIRTVDSGAKAKWKNGVIIDLSTSDRTRNLSLKLSVHNIHSAGGKSVENGEEGATFLLAHLRRIQDTLDAMKRNPEERQKVLDWISEEVRGDPLLRAHDVLINEYPPIAYLEWKFDSSIRSPDNIPFWLNEEFARFFLQYTRDYIFFQDYWAKIQEILVLDAMISPKLSLLPTRTEMANCNYTLGYRVNRLNLALFFHGRNGFLAQYNNTAGHRVRITYPLDEEQQDGNGKRNKPRRHTFMVTMSGAVTQSGPWGMDWAYQLFLRTFSEVKDLVIR